MKIVLAVDHSPHSELAVREIAARPWPQDAVVRVLHVVDIVALTSAALYTEPFLKKANEEAWSLTQSVAKRLGPRGLKATAEVIEGYPSTGIVDYASDWGADFILVGSHGYSRLIRFLLGSVAKAVLLGAHCSVEVVRPADDRPAGLLRGGMKILLATDGSDYSVAAAHSLARRPWPEGSEVKIVSVVDPMVPAMEPWYAAAEVIERLREEKGRQAHEAISDVEKILSDAGLKTASEVLEGSPKNRIVEAAEAWGADLIVVGSHGRRGITRLLLGSVSESVALHAHCSVDVIRGGRP